MAYTFYRTWQMSFNYTLDNTSNANAMVSSFWFQKSLMTGTGGLTYFNNSGSSIGSPSGFWTVYGSSDSSTAGLDGTDRWGTTYNVSKLVQNTTGNAHSWIVLKSPNNYGGVPGNIYYYIDFSIGTGQTRAALYISKTAPTGGSTTTLPSATDICRIDTNNNGAIVLNSTSARAHGGVSTSGDVFFATSTVGSGAIFFISYIGTLDETRKADTFPFFAFAGGGNGNTANLPTTPGLIGSNNYGFTRDAKNQFTPAVDALVWGPFGSGTRVLANQGIDAGDGAFTRLPIYIWAASAGSYSIKGRIPDLYWAPENLPQVTLDNANSTQYFTVGNWWIPTYTTPTV